MRYLFLALVFASCFAMLMSHAPPKDSPIGLLRAIDYFKANAKNFASLAVDLQSAIAGIDARQPLTVQKARTALKACRLSYKKIEFFLEYFFKSNAKFYNGAPKVEIEEPYMEWQTPIGLQVIESLLFENDVNAHKNDLVEQADALASSALDIPALLYNFKADDKQILESVRLEIIRVCTLVITGFDAPLLKTGIEESAASFEALRFVLAPYIELPVKKADSVGYYIDSGIKYLNSSEDFDSFDRLAFLTDHALPLQEVLGVFIRTMQLEVNTTGNVLNYNAANLYSPDAINLAAFPRSHVPETPELINLGRKLFNETGLSGNNKISCATCHQPGKHFTDALPKSIAFNGHSALKRNAPSLIYAAFQYEQFWDGRAKSLEEQVSDVLKNPLEMNGDALTNIKQLIEDKRYAVLFRNAYQGESDSLTIIDKIAVSIAAFVRTLHFRSSDFDRYMQGDKPAMNRAGINGFNLFMGKAQCGTCHFAPLFNGLIPPLYDISELEVLGTPGTDDFNKPAPDEDKGRYDVFPIEFYDKAFKTPSVRNASVTAPYMHNGAFQTLENVVEFYNKGGGQGMGLPVSNQTLSANPLNLSKSEIADIVSFLQALEDTVQQE